LLVLLKEKADY